MCDKGKKHFYSTIIAAPTRSGKGVSSIIPVLLSFPGNVIPQQKAQANSRENACKEFV
jgi:type IV secretory pathway TraG/TraD family ATPase VirD4